MGRKLYKQKVKQQVKLNDKQKKFLIGCLILFLVFIFGNFYVKDAYAVRYYFTNQFVQQAQLFDNDVIEQEFTPAEGDQGVQLLLGTYIDEIKGGTAKAELFDSQGKKITETSVDLAGTKDEQYVNFYFGKLDSSLYNQKCMVRFTFSEMEDQFGKVYNSKNSSQEYGARLNGVEQQYTYIMNGIEKTTYVEYRDIRGFYMLAFCVVLLYVAIYKKDSFQKNKESFYKRLELLWENSSLSVLKMFGVIIGCGMLARFVGLLLPRATSYDNPYRTYAIFVGLFVIACMCVFQKSIWKHVHVWFFIVSVLLGSVYIMGTPVVATGWDEAFHYAQTSYMSQGATREISEADYLTKMAYAHVEYEDIFGKEGRLSWQEDINAIDASGSRVVYEEGVSLNSISYIPASIVLWIARVLGMSFSTRWILGKLTNLCLYSLLIATSIKMFKGRGKLLAAMVGLIPTNIIIASSYGYDWWLTAFIILGYAIFISELQESETISTKKLMQAVAMVSIGLLVKAVYFPLLLPMMLLKKKSYQDAKKARGFVIGAMVLLVLSFVLPMLISVGSGAIAGGGDLRGGNDVNAGAQIAYILNNIGEYAKTLLTYMKSYLNPDQAGNYMTMITYRGRGEYYTLCLIVLGVAAALDNSEKLTFYSKEPYAVWGGYLGVIGTLVLVVTALYVAYTAVGENTVFGCQPRYILPVVFPFLYFIGENKMQLSEPMKSKLFSWSTVSMALISLWGCYQVYIVNY